MEANGSGNSPSTPSKGKEALIRIERIIKKLNFDYNLEIQLPDLSLTPAKRKEISANNEQLRRWDQIYNALRYLYFQRDGSLEMALDSFLLEAKSISKKRFHKPQGDQTILPSPSMDFPKASTQEQQIELENQLVKSLNYFKDSKVLSRQKVSPKTDKTPRHPFPEQQDGSNLSTNLPWPPLSIPQTPQKQLSQNSPSNSPPSAGSKRSVDLYESSDDRDSKRTKGLLFPLSKPKQFSGELANPFDDVPGRQHPGGGPPAPIQAQARPWNPLPPSQFTSSRNSTGSGLFSQRDEFQSTQSLFQASLPKNQFTSTPSAPKMTSAFATSRPLPVISRPAGSSIRESAVSPAKSLSSSESDSRSESDTNSFSDISDSDNNRGGATIQNPHPSLVINFRQLRLNAPSNHSHIRARLQNIWPKFPQWLHDAPLAVVWEVTRICLHCKVDLEEPSLHYNPKWATSSMTEIWRSLSQLDVFRGKSFPERPSAEVWEAALTTFEKNGNSVVMSASLEFNPDKTGPLFLIDMKPLRFDEGCRLTRYFGSDRFLEILFPSPTASNAPPILKQHNNAEEVIKWLTETPHSFVGRHWQAFYSKDAGYRKPAKEFRLGQEADPISKERVHFFAEDGHRFRQPLHPTYLSPPDTVSSRFQIKISQMLDWLLQLEHNEDQPYLKLFSRIQLGLSKTIPALTFEPHQIIHREKDILSPIGKVMNDGIGRMSRSVARKIRDALGLTDIPSAIQGRMGSAKGMWLMDVADTSDEDWIETYPSQRKWHCNWNDPAHRTLEVRSVPTELKPAGLNLQFLPILEAQAKDKAQMRYAIGERLKKDLETQFELQKSALNHPLKFRQWVNEDWSSRSERVRNGQVLFLGGLPESKHETLFFLLNSGFDPKKQKYLQKLAWELQYQRCELLKTKLNIKVGRSAYVYMVVDFWGMLEENEVHLGFSSRFCANTDLDQESFTLLADCDVLVARSPAHFVSDVQKVRAVFKPELHALKDVIVFPLKGNVALADKLSGGDYDGDMAWVCWDPDIVNSFTNAEVPPEPDLSAYLRKDKTTFSDLVDHAQAELGVQNCYDRGLAREKAVYDMITKSFIFAMQPSFLGICTNYKEKLCYRKNCVSDDDAIILSTLVGKLVDQSKQGIIFTKENWDQMRKDYWSHLGELTDPAYKGNHWEGKDDPAHIIDYLKFKIAKPAIDREMAALKEKLDESKHGRPALSSLSSSQDNDSAQFWDPDLIVYYNAFNELAQTSHSIHELLEALQKRIKEVHEEWAKAMSPKTSSTKNLSYQEKVRRIYEKWRAIDFKSCTTVGSNGSISELAIFLEQPFLANGCAATSCWELLKASTAFKMCYHGKANFVWQIAGRQLAFIKAQMTCAKGTSGDEEPVLVTPLMYAGLAPDGKFVKQYMARIEGEGTSYPDLEDGDAVGECRDDANIAGWGGPRSCFRGDDVD